MHAPKPADPAPHAGDTRTGDQTEDALPGGDTRTGDQTDDALPGGDTPGRRERKKQQTREAILAAAHGLFASKGYRETRVADIAEAADVSEATFFRYFATKEDVALEGVKARIEAVVDALEERPRDELPLAACLAVMDTPGAFTLVPTETQINEFRLLGENPNLSGHFLWHVSIVTQRLATDFAERLGGQQTDLMPRLLANSVVGALYTVFQIWIIDPTSDPWQQAGESFRLLARGLEPEAGGKRLSR